MKLTLKIAALLIASCGLSSAATVSVACTTDADFTTNPVSFANELNSTWTARVGFYDGTALTTAATFSTINAHWTNVGSVAFATGGGAAGVDGWFSLSGASYDSVATGLGGKQVFVWVSNGTTGNLVMGATGAAAGSFTFKNNTDIPSTTISGVKASAVGAWNLVLGTYTATGANSAGGGSYVVNVVPEPSAALLGAFGALALLRRRRA